MDQQTQIPSKPTEPGESRPVLIVGAGPTGLTAALELMRFGIAVRLVDRLPAPATTTRAHSVQTRTLELFEQRGLTQQMLPLGNPATAANLYGGGKQLGKIDLTQIKSRYNYTFLLAQVRIEHLLRERLAEQGVAVEQGTELVAFAQLPSEERPGTSDGVRAMLRHPGGRVEELAAAYLICAEGAHSTIRPTSGLQFEGKSLEQSYVLADLSLDGDLPENELVIFAADHGFLAVFPLGGGTFRLVATDPARHAKTDPAPALAELQQIYDQDAALPARLRDLTWSSRYVINSRLIHALRVGNVFFGGDAAHIHSPVGGQGMNTGIQDMINLSWKLALVLQGRAVPELLDTFEADRLPIIRNVVTKTEAATEALNSASPLTHQLITHLAPLALGTHLVQQLATGLLSETALHYRASPLSQTGYAPGALRAGDRVPDLLVRWNTDSAGEAEPQETPLYALLDPSRFILLVAGPDHPEHLPADWEQQLRPWQGLLLTHHLSAPLAAEDKSRFTSAFGRGPGLWLVRPDAYFGFVAGAASLPALLAWLTRWLPVADA